MIPVYQFSFTAAIIALLTLFAPGAMAQAENNRATFPANFEQMAMYGDYRRGTGGELAYALRETIDIAKAGQPLPPGTRLVLEIYDNGTLTGYFVMEKGIDWGLDFAAEQRTGDWHFQQFGTDKQVRRTAISLRLRTTTCSRSTGCGPTSRETLVPVPPVPRFPGSRLIAGRSRL
jgi:hypothetical protein